MEFPKTDLKAAASSVEVLPALSGHIPALDGIRGIAILLVIMLHACNLATSQTGLPGTVFQRLTKTGWIGVDLFFVLSGFLITGILLDTREAENYISSFYMRRALRILPLAYATLLFFLVFSPLLGKLGVPHMAQKFYAQQLWYWFFYVGNWINPRHMFEYVGHFWSLCVEEQFYLVWPWIVFATSRRTLAKVCVILPPVAMLLRITLPRVGVDPLAIYYLTVTRIDGLPLGALAALMARDPGWIGRFRLHRRYFIYPALVIVVVISLVNGGFDGNGWSYEFGQLPLVVFFASILLFCIPGMGAPSRLEKYLGAGWLRSCGKYSYAMYVLHSPLCIFYYEHISSRFGPLSSFAFITIAITQFAVVFVVIYCLARLSWWALEGRVNSLKRHFQARYNGRPTSPVATQP